MKMYVCSKCEKTICTCTRREVGKPMLCPDGKGAAWHIVKKNFDKSENEA